MPEVLAPEKVVEECTDALDEEIIEGRRDLRLLMLPDKKELPTPVVVVFGIDPPLQDKSTRNALLTDQHEHGYYCLRKLDVTFKYLQQYCFLPTKN